MKNSWLKFPLFIALLLFIGCNEEEVGLDVEPPTEQDAQFTYAATAASDNIIEFTASTDGLRYSWDLGNGEPDPGNVQTATGTYPNEGTYTVTLTVFNEGGSASSSQEITIAQTDPTLLDNEIYNLLTGGVDGGGSKTWAVDSASAGHFGVGPSPSNADYAGLDEPTYYAAGANEKRGAGMYNDRYTFNLEGFGFDFDAKGDIYINAEQGPNFPDAYDPGVGDLTTPFTPDENLTWTVNIPSGEGDTTLTIQENGILGYFTGVRTYKIVTLTENELFLQFEDAANADLVWYIRLVPEGFDSTEGGETTSPYADFEGGQDLTEAILTGGTSKAWKLKEAAGAFGVGATPQSDAFYPNGADISAERPCLFNDLFIFSDGGAYEYDAQGDIFVEPYMGIDSSYCANESVLAGTFAEPWTSTNTHTFSFSSYTDANNPATITVTGTGAFIALPKAYNNGEYGAADEGPTADASVTYSVTAYDTTTEELSISVQVAEGVFWSFILVPAQ